MENLRGFSFLTWFMVLQLSQLIVSEYPNLNCHKGYGKEIGDHNAKMQTEHCKENAKDFPCLKLCQLHMAGVVHRWGKTWKMQDQRAMKAAFLKNWFKDDQDGKATAEKLSEKITTKCQESMAKDVSSKKPCEEWTEFYECVDKIWLC